MKKKLNVSWETTNTDAKLKKFQRYLKDKGVRQSTIDDYINRVERYIKFCGKKEPSPELAQKYREYLLDNELSNSSVANYSYAIKSYHKMLGQEVNFPFLKRNNIIPNYFNVNEVNNIFEAISNIKHLAIFKTAFYACLRASEVADLDIEDIDLDRLTLKVREGKGGKSAVCYLQEEAAEILNEYLAIRPDFEIAGSRPLFFTDYGQRFNRKDIYRLVIHYKNLAGIKKPGGAHVLFRHTPASIMIAGGCDLLTIQSVMRHNHIGTTMRYLHMADDMKRAKYDKFLKI